MNSDAKDISLRARLYRRGKNFSLALMRELGRLEL
jgi:hypothetical protein